jgi:hypothetical protein
MQRAAIIDALATSGQIAGKVCRRTVGIEAHHSPEQDAQAKHQAEYVPAGVLGGVMSVILVLLRRWCVVCVLRYSRDSIS